MTGLIGISYKSADLEIRERFAFSKEEIATFTKQLLTSDKIRGVVILSTCNRTEIYYHAPQNSNKDVLQLIMGALTLHKHYYNELKPYFISKTANKW